MRRGALVAAMLVLATAAAAAAASWRSCYHGLVLQPRGAHGAEEVVVVPPGLRAVIAVDGGRVVPVKAPWPHSLVRTRSGLYLYPRGVDVSKFSPQLFNLGFLAAAAKKGDLELVLVLRGGSILSRLPAVHCRIVAEENKHGAKIVAVQLPFDADVLARLYRVLAVDNGVVYVAARWPEASPPPSGPRVSPYEPPMSLLRRGGAQSAPRGGPPPLELLNRTMRETAK